MSEREPEVIAARHACLRLVDALRPALEAQRNGYGAVVVHLVENRSTLPLEMDRKLLLVGPSSQVGSLHPMIDEAAYQLALSALAAGRPALYSVLPGEPGGQVVDKDRGCVDCFADVLVPAPSLVIIGAGHIALPLARLGKVLDFSVTVVDDRPNFANPDRFPAVDAVIVSPFAEALSTIPITPNTYIVLVTRGHVHDQACLEQVLRSPAPYIGMIGSQRRVRTVMRTLRAEGFSSAELERVYAPIGLAIGAESPAEIAVAIAAEIIALRRGKDVPHLALGQRLYV